MWKNFLKKKIVWFDISTYRSTEQNQDFRNKPIHSWPTDFCQGFQKDANSIQWGKNTL